MEFRILGPLDVRVNGRSLDLGGLRQRRVLAALLLAPNRAVPVARLAEAAWGDSPPETGRRQVQNRVAALRRLLTRHGGVIDSHDTGYLLRVGPGELDVDVFDDLVARGRAAGDPALLRQALRLWRGPALAGLDGDLLRQGASELDERRLAAHEECLALGLAAGEPGGLVDELRGLVAAHPLREGLTGQLMTYLYGQGNRAEALAVYRQLADRLAEQLGIDPGPQLRELRAEIDRDAPPAAATTVRPAQLPADVSRFTGRWADLARLDRLLSDGHLGPAVVISAIAGTAGVGKTALAVHWAHRVRDKFPDGQLYVNLRGYAPSPPLRPIDALGGFLRALGVPPDQVPAEPDEAAARYREVLAGRRYLIVLDNAAGAEQVRPLLPGGPASLALITSRDALAGLTGDDGARRLVLDVLVADEARELLAGVLGADRVAAEPAAADELARLCGHLPLALRIAAANLSEGESIGGYAARLATGNRLSALTVDGDEQAAVGAAFALSYAALAPATRRMFRLLGLVYGPDITAPAAAALADVSTADAARLLDELVAAHLLEERATGRYGCHDLLRLFAADHAGTEESSAERAAAAGRLLDHYVATCDHAARLISPHALRLPDRPAEAASHLASAPEALDWLDAELANLVALTRHTGEHGPHRAAWLLADAMRAYFFRRTLPVEAQAVAEAGLSAAEAAADPAAQSLAHLGLGDLYWRRAKHTQALAHFERTLVLAREAGWRMGETAAVGRLGAVYRAVGATDKAVEYLSRAATLAREVDWSGAEATALTNLAGLYMEEGKLALAAEQLRSTIQLGERIGHGAVVAMNSASLAETYRLLGRYDEALALFERAMAMFAESGEESLRADQQRAIASLHCDAGRPEQALPMVEEVLAEAQRTDDPYLEITCGATAGAVHHALGDHRTAVSHYEQALARVRAADMRPAEPEILVGLAAAHRTLGDVDRALELAEQALAGSRAVRFRVQEGGAQAELAAIELARGRADEAIGHAEQALLIHEETGYRLGAARTLRVLGSALHAAGRPPEARSRWAEALAAFTDLGTPEADDVRALRLAADGGDTAGDQR